MTSRAAADGIIPPPRLGLSIDESSASLGISRSVFYRRLIDTGRIRVIRLAGGRRVVVPVSELERVLAEELAAAEGLGR